MNIIHLLPPTVANQIAAGEVIQRPASVIKELLENSIDAGATHIQVILAEAGRELIQVIDNGQGMTAEDAVMAFEKHATSKISTTEDLFGLHTMGFRGEALASIAAVAEVQLRTRREEDETGTLVALANGEIVRAEVCTCPVGANFEIRNLFYNIPARRKFLKNNKTEFSHILQEVQRVALTNPRVGFEVFHNGVLYLELTAGTQVHRIEELFHKDKRQLAEIKTANDLVSLHGYVLAPKEVKKSGAQQFFFVNNRYIRQSSFHKAVIKAFEDLIPGDRQPSYFIWMEVNPESIDVNINPTKTEVKFEYESGIWQILNHEVRNALSMRRGVAMVDFAEADPIGTQVVVDDPRLQGTTQKQQKTKQPNPFNVQPSSFWDSAIATFMQERQEIPTQEQLMNEQQTTPAYNQQLQFAVEPEAHVFEPSACMQIGQKYIVSEDKDCMLLIDQSRAHLCVLYDQYLGQISQRQGVTQLQVIPETFQLSAADEVHLQSILPELSYLGFDIDSLGGGTYSVNGKPASFENCDIEEFIGQMVETAREEVNGIREELDRKLALRMAKSQAIGYGKKLSEPEMKHLVASLMALPEHTITPDGRAVVMKKISEYMLDNML